MLLRQSAASRGSSTAAAAQQRPRSHERCMRWRAPGGRLAAAARAARPAHECVCQVCGRRG
jgi:hypothetical protein